MFNMFVIALEPFKSHCYFLFIYHLKKYGLSKSKLTYFRNRDIVYCVMCPVQTLHFYSSMFLSAVIVSLLCISVVIISEIFSFLLKYFNLIWMIFL